MAAKPEVSSKPEHLTPQVTPEKVPQETLTPTHERITRTPSFRGSHKRMSRRSKTPSVNSLHCGENDCLADESDFDINDTVIINCGGVRHEVLKKTIHRHPDTRLAKIVNTKKHYRETKKEFYFDRDPYIFAAILNYYRYGELHLPSDICNVVVAKELKYWGIEEDNIEACCWLEYNAAWDQMHMLSQFEEKQTINVTIPSGEKASCFQRNRPKIWLMLEDPYSSKSAQIMAWVSLAFVVVSIFSFCAETHPQFTYTLTEEEYNAYHGMTLTGVLRGLHIIPDNSAKVGQNPRKVHPSENMSNSSFSAVTKTATRAEWDNQEADSFSPNAPGNDFLWQEDGSQGQTNNEDRLESQSRLTANGAAGAEENKQQMGADKKMDDSMASSQKDRSNGKNMHLDSAGRLTGAQHAKADEVIRRAKRDDPVTLEENESFFVTTAQPETTVMSAYDKKKISRFTKPHPVLFFIDIICYCFFTIEIIVRFVFCDNRLTFFKDMFNLVDLVAILPFYVEIIVNSLYQEEQYKKSIVDVLLFTRILRIFRIFRLIRRHRGLQILVYTINASMKEILLLLLFVIIGTILFSSLVYYAEEASDRPFASIPHSFWWAVITMTTVGYGDMVPHTSWGFVIGACCSVSGVLLIAFTVPVIVNNFLLIYRYVQFQRERLDPAEAAFRQKWETKLTDSSSDISIRKATIHVHVEADANNDGNAINAV